MPEVRSTPITGERIAIATDGAPRPEGSTRMTRKRELPPPPPDRLFCPGDGCRSPSERFRVPPAHHG